MKIVLSRKGFDSGSGRVPNPILPNGRLVPLPIPARRDPHTYDEIKINETPLGQLVEDLTSGRLRRSDRCHLDPDLDEQSLPRQPGWRPAFGQINAAQSHLARHGVGSRDLFLFFGWFRAVERVDGRWRYVRGAPDLHIIYGWLQVGDVVALNGSQELPARLMPFAYHPHLRGRDHPSNTLYIAADSTDLSCLKRQAGGIFRDASPSRILTDRTQSKRSIWRLPPWFHPDNGTRLSYHDQPIRWRQTSDGCVLSSVARGQEFVIQSPNSHHSEQWLESIFDRA